MRVSAKVTVVILVGCFLGGGARAAAPEGLAVAQLAVVERLVEQAATPDGWRKAKEGGALRIGERLRTPADGVAAIEFPWMMATLGPSTILSFPDAYLLATQLEQGRLELKSEGRDILKLQTSEAEVRGRGRVVVRRQGGSTVVMALGGRFLVEGAGKTVSVAQGKGTIVRSGKAPIPPVSLGEAPGELWPGADPIYAAHGEAVAFNWKSKELLHQIAVLPVGSDLVLMHRDVGAPPVKLEIPWTGAFRWRVSTRDERGLEGLPAEGFVCVVDK
jgi:hypothetical protein